MPSLAFVLIAGRNNWRHQAKPLAAAIVVCVVFAAWRLASVPSPAAFQIDGGYGLKELLTRPFAKRPRHGATPR